MTNSQTVTSAESVSRNVTEPMSTTTEFQPHAISRPYTTRPRTPRTSQASRAKYPSDLSALPQRPHHPQQHKYEGFEELLREAGYKETRIFTPERERVGDKNEIGGGKLANRGGEKRREASKVRSMVGFLAGFLASGTVQPEDAHDEQRHSKSSKAAQHVEDSTFSSPSLNSRPPSSPSTPPLLSTSPPSFLPPGTPHQTRHDIHMEMQTPTPSNHNRNHLYLQSNSSYASVASTSTATQPKYLRSAHIQNRQRQSADSVGSHEISRPSSSRGKQRQQSDMVPPPVPPLPRQYLDQNRPLSRPETPPLSRTHSRPSTPSGHPPRPLRSRNMDSDPTPRLRPSQTDPLPSSVHHPMPSKAHAYLRHMASAQKIFDDSLSDSESQGRLEGREGEEEDTPKPRLPRPRSTPGAAFKGLNLWASFTSSVSSNSTSSSSTSASNSTSATSPPTSSGLSRSSICSPERYDDDGSEPDEEIGGYFNLIRSRSQSRTRRDGSRTRYGNSEDEGSKWWRLRQSRSMVQVKVQEEDEEVLGPSLKRTKSSEGIQSKSKPILDPTNLSAHPSAALPYLVMRLSSPAPPLADDSRGRVQEKKTRVYCRSQSMPRRKASTRGRWGKPAQGSEEPVHILVANTSDTESNDGHGSGDMRDGRQYFSELDSNPTTFPTELDGSGTSVAHISPPPRQNSIRSLRRHLKRDPDAESSDGIPTTGMGGHKDRGGLPGPWLQQ